jgi:hypothetical protein
MQQRGMTSARSASWAAGTLKVLSGERSIDFGPAGSAVQVCGVDFAVFTLPVRTKAASAGTVSCGSSPAIVSMPADLSFHPVLDITLH